MKKYPFRCARKTERRFNDEKKNDLGCSCCGNDSRNDNRMWKQPDNNRKQADKADKLESQTDLSSTDYDFEKEYAYGDFNAHSRSDEDRHERNRYI